MLTGMSYQKWRQRLEVVAGWKVVGDVEVVVEGVGVDTYTGARLDMSVLQ